MRTSLVYSFPLVVLLGVGGYLWQKRVKPPVSKPTLQALTYQFTSEVEFALADNAATRSLILLKGQVTIKSLGQHEGMNLSVLSFANIVDQGIEPGAKALLAGLTSKPIYIESHPSRYFYRMVPKSDSPSLNNLLQSIARAFYHPYILPDGSLAAMRYESDALGRYAPTRTIKSKNGSVIEITKQFQSYTDTTALHFVEPTHIWVAYDLTRNALSAYRETGHMTSRGEQGVGESRYSVVVSPVQDQAGAPPSFALSKATIADYAAVRLSAAEGARGHIQSIKSLLATMDAAPSSKVVYENFQKVRELLEDAPELLADLGQAARSLNLANAADQRKLSFIAGVLAQCHLPAAEHELDDLLAEAQTEAERIQYTAALGDFAIPSMKSVDALKIQIQNPSSPTVQNSALLALGSVGSRLDDPTEYSAVEGYISALLASSQDQKEKAGIIAAMGNLGGDQYRDLLLANTSDPLASVRAAAYYALRTYQDSAATEAILAAALTEKQSSVLAEALKVLLVRLAQNGVAGGVAGIALASQQSQLQSMVVYALKEHNEENPEEIQAALTLIGERTTFANIKTLLQR